MDHFDEIDMGTILRLGYRASHQLFRERVGPCMASDKGHEFKPHDPVTGNPPYCCKHCGESLFISLMDLNDRAAQLAREEKKSTG